VVLPEAQDGGGGTASYIQPQPIRVELHPQQLPVWDLQALALPTEDDALGRDGEDAFVHFL
jgi:hypothetical protein